MTHKVNATYFSGVLQSSSIVLLVSNKFSTELSTVIGFSDYSLTRNPDYKIFRAPVVWFPNGFYTGKQLPNPRNTIFLRWEVK